MKTHLVPPRDRLKPFARPVCIMTGVYALGICAILRANYNYVDDMVRVYGGSSGWEMSSRYLSDFLAVFLHADRYLSDISPLPQLAACALLAAASVIVLYLITGRKRFTVWEYAAVLPLGLSPYMLECLSFKFDAPYMALSVLASVAPLLAIRRGKPGWLLGIASALGTMAMCNTYQAASGILPMFTVLLAFRMWAQGGRWRDILRFTAVTAAGYCAAMIGYKLLIVQPTQVSYVSSAMTPLPQLVPQAIGTFRTYVGYILTEFDPKWLVLMGLTAAAFVILSVRDCARNKLAALVLSLVCLALLAVLSFGLYPLLAKPLIQPRTMYGLGAAIAFMAVPAASARKALPAKVVCLALAWCFFVFAFTYGNTLYSQKVYTEFRIQEVLDAVKQEWSPLYAPQEQVMVQFEGDIGHAPAIGRTLDRFPLLKKLVPHTFGDYSWMTYYSFSKYYGLPSTVSTSGSDVDLTKFHLPLLDETRYHAIYGDELFLLIELK